MDRFLRLFLLLLLSAAANAQSYSKDSLVSIIEKSKYVEGYRIGTKGQKSSVYETAEILWEQCTPDELVKLCSSKDPKVRCYAFLGVVDSFQDRKTAEQIADLHKSDSQKILSWNYGIQGTFTVSEYMEMQLREYYGDEKGYRRLGK